MKTKPTFLLILALFLGLTGFVHGQYVYNLPQVADGSGIRTTFVFFNNSTAAANITLSLFDDAGSTMAFNLPGLGSSGVYTFTLQPGHTRFYQSTASGSLVVGSARVASSAPIGVSAIFTLYSGQSILTEAGVGASEAVTRFTIAVDTRESRNTGLAIQNLSPMASVDTTVTFRLFNSAGQALATTTRTMPKFGHLALFVGGEDGLFPDATNFRGQVEVSSTSQVAALTLLQHASGAPLTSLPVVPLAASQTSFNLPQVANGFQAEANIGVKTTFIMFNPGSEPATVSLDLTNANGEAFPVTLDDGQTGSQFTFSLAARATRFVSTNGSGPITTGAARVRSNVPVGVSAIFRLVNGQGAIITETGVGDSPANTRLTLPVDLTSGFNTGVALFNNNGSTASVWFQLIDRNGGIIDQSPEPQAFVVLNQAARYVNEMFPGVTNIQGQLAITSTLPITAVTLRQGSNGSPMTTMPVSPGVTTTETPLGAKAVQKRILGIDVNKDTQLDVRLDPGNELKGTISVALGSTLAPVLARAISTGGEVFPGYLRAPGVGRQRWEYSSYVPNGTYTLQVLVADSQGTDQNGAELPNVSYHVNAQEGIVVTGTTSKDIALSNPTTYTVSGNVQQLLRLPATALDAHSVALLFSSSETGAAALASLNSIGGYSAKLPSGKFRVDLAILLTEGQNQVKSASVLASIGLLTVNGRPLSGVDFSVPELVSIQGQVIQPALPSIPQGAFVVGIDTDAPTPPFLQLPLFPISPGFSFASAGGGQYRLYVQRDQPYDLTAGVPLQSSNQNEVRVWSAPLPGTATEVFTADAIRDFTFSPPLNPFKLTGTVTSAQGAVLEYVLVNAVCNSLDGAANTSFSASVVTGPDGKFELNLAPGTNYSLSFTPSAPPAAGL
ncbi:MAG: carboxypeptidase regulatory-like domain-containing protein [Acidobacteria bacterium]|nr:MAG: carboxypeptidase regulatory-like domain-containing protein [Acidobacteriota bacterium]